MANITNSEPEILDIDVLDENQNPTSTIDPGSDFFIDIDVRDNNTLGDLIEITVVVYSSSSSPSSPDSEEDHYTFSWTPVGFVNTGGVGAIDPVECQEPGSMILGQGSWRFAVALSKNAEQGTGWTVLVRAEDESESDQSSTTVEVTSYVSLVVEASQLSFSGAPGQTVGASQNPIQMSYSSNHAINLGSFCTQFVGVQEPSFVIEPSSFSVDDDPNPSESGETGEDEVTLSTTRQAVLTSLPSGEHDIQLYVFVDIPEPFLDQDYTGTLSFELYS